MHILFKEVKKNHALLLSLFITILFGITFWQNFTQHYAQHFSLMAESFIHGRFDLMRLDPETGSLDIFFHNGKMYFANFPFPAVILIPFFFIFQKFNLFFYQGYLQFFLNIGVFYICYLLAKKFKFNYLDSLYLALAFFFGSNYAFAALYTGSWFYSQPVTVLLLLLALYEWYTKRRLLVVGTLLGCLLATRATAGLAAAFFGIALLFEKGTIFKEKFKKLILLGSPILISFVLLLGYNQARFGSPWETGYMDDNISPEFQVTMLKKYGIFKLENIPTNIYWNFLSLPEPIMAPGTYHLIPPFLDPNPLGMSFFIMSPIFLLIFKSLKKPSGDTVYLWIGSLFVLIPLLMWYSTGFWQIGARYILDFFPLWFILLLKVFPNEKLKDSHRLIILLSCLLNLFWIMPRLITGRW